MLLRLAITLVLVTGLAGAAEKVRPQPGEGTLAYQCRAAYVPEVRQCASRCDAAALAGDARFECVHACTTKGLWDMAHCRAEGPSAGAASALAAR